MKGCVEVASLCHSCDDLSGCEESVDSREGCGGWKNEFELTWSGLGVELLYEDVHGDQRLVNFLEERD